MDFTKPHTLLASPGKKLFPVIHVQYFEQAYRNIMIANQNGADGIFLISHSPLVGARELMRLYHNVRVNLPDMFIGLNFLDLTATEAFDYVKNDHSVSALWVDDSGITDKGYTPDALRLQRNMEQSDWSGAYFAGVAFKGQTPVELNAVATDFASSHCHVVTTSGSGTGSAPPAAKLHTMHCALRNNSLLANASGTDLDNIEILGPHADIFMVATGINQDDDFYNLHPDRVRAMKDQLEAL